MLNLPGIKILAQIYESVNSLVYRGIRLEDNQAIILKVLKENYPTPAELARYRTEYEMTQSLNLSGVIKAYHLQKYQNTLVMFLEDFGGESLKIWMQQCSFTLEEFLQIAIAITNSLGQIHATNIIHKDINPSNIVFNPTTRQIKIIDFGISTQLTKENTTLKNPNVLEGTLAYMSPEQTGRMNRSLDYRSDFYSLGVTFYELLTHQLPFSAIDALELVHCHIAKQPLSPSEINSEIPLILSDIVMKLMAKTSEERYQSAFGIQSDLEKCLSQLQHHNIISNFTLADQDIADKFQLPQKLYGREREIEILLTAFERVTVQSEMILIGGYSGIGKTALVQEIYKPITQKRGYFISGKFDQYQRNIPYSAVVIAFQSLVKQLLTESEAQLKEWREKLLAALGINGQVIIDVIPEVELIIGQQPALPELGATESQNRFNLVFQNFIKVFTKPEHPLVLFIDDLQWADGASLKLMQVLMSSSSPGLFLMGAYRDNEVSPAHPFILTVDEIAKTGAIINQIFLSPLELSTVTQILCDTLKFEPEKVKSLAELIQFKTGGNPFFMNEFLKSLYTEGLLEFDFKALEWHWDLEQIQVMNFTDNVVELMASKIKKLPENTQKMLKLAACIGNQFDLYTLAITSEKNIPQTVNNLQAAVAENLVMNLENREDFVLAANGEFSNLQFLEYKFVHDKIQQAAYSLISESDKVSIHYKIGILLLENTPKNKLEERIFDIVNQLNFGIEMISNQSNQLQRDELAQLNLIAGKKAKASAAYQPAFNYLQIGRDLLRAEGWKRQYELTLAVYVELIEVAYLTGNFEQMNALIEIVLQQARTLLDRVKVIEVKIIALIAHAKIEQAIDTGLNILNELEVKLPRSPNKIYILIEFIQSKFILMWQRIEDLYNFPQMEDPYKLAAIRILTKIGSAAYFAEPKLIPIIAFKSINLLVKYGNAFECAVVYAIYGVILCSTIQDIELGYKFGQLALNLLERLNANKLKSQVILLFTTFISHWKVRVKDTLPLALEGYRIGLENGNLEYATYCANLYCYQSYLSGQELTGLELQMAAYGKIIEQLRQKPALFRFKLFHQSVFNLLNYSQDPCLLIGSACDEKSLLPLLEQKNDSGSIFTLYLNKLILCYLFEQYFAALSNANLSQKYLEYSTGLFQFTYFYFYDSLVCSAVYFTVSKVKQKHYLKKIKANQKKLKKWSYYAPTNHLHKFYLVEAELCRLQNINTIAMGYYDQAIALAKENEYIHEAALAYELAAKFYLSRSQELTAKAYMQEACYCYQLWGATAKVKHLETQYPHLVNANKPTNTSIKTTTTGSGSNLDIATVMKASQAISGEIEIEHLLSSLMRILMENAGAQRGYLILFTQGKLLIEAQGTIESEQVTVLQSIPVENCQMLSESVVNYVARTQESVVLNHATQEGQFTNDFYIKNHHPKSILCVPLINQGQLISIVYLENNLTIGAFTTERQKMLNLLSAQAAISIENAQLYKNMAELNQAYERFVPRQFLQFLEKSSIVDVKLGDNVQLEMSVLFSDIRGFTTLSESMTPEENFQFINSYLSQMEPAILENQGFIDKYIGDAIMALFSGEADNAVKAGISMLKQLKKYNFNIEKNDQPKLQIGIGINTGSLMLGTVGGQNRMDGTVISDAVNLASRVESLTKNYGVSLLITQQTYSRLTLPSDYLIRMIDTVKVKGKMEAVTVYEVFDADSPDVKEGKLATLSFFTEALRLYSEGKFAEAGRLFAECWNQSQGDDVAKIYWQRCQQQ